jgi:hypothetical protein
MMAAGDQAPSLPWIDIPERFRLSRKRGNALSFVSPHFYNAK